ncbi:MAG: CpsD/CapB family tyrosine-protein kinase [Bacillota bacterium]|nr:CpsD/CapB family tyrosine-protein kinase [Bacillota bacterium]
MSIFNKKSVKNENPEKDKHNKHGNITAEEINKIDMDLIIRKTILNEQTPFLISEAYKAARTNIMFALKDNKGCKKVIITSANPGEGKSTNCVNIAISFAQMGERVLIVDADMRRPRLHRYFKIKNKNGTSNILGGFSSVDECIYHDEGTNVDVITAGHVPPNPAELLASEEMDNMLEQLVQMYDYIFIDTPPINVVTDVALIAKKVTGVMIVVRHNITSRDMIDRCINSLNFAGARLMGFVLNAVEHNEYVGKYTYNSYKKYGIKKYGYRKYGKYGYGKYGYGKYGYGKYGYGYGDTDYEDDTNGDVSN